MKDYFAILGLDSGASLASIKVAYRRLAYQYHPDRLAGADAAEADAIGERMREINEAYHVLSNEVARRDYERGMVAVTAAAPAPARVVTPPPPPARPVRRAASDISKVVSSSVLSEFSASIRKKVASSGGRWRETRWEGFEWAMVSGIFPWQYAVALRGFPAADLPTAEKMTNYAELAVAQASSLRFNAFLFLLPVQRIAQLDQVTARLRQFSYASRKGSAREIVVALADAGHQKFLLCGPDVREAAFASLLRRLGLSAG